MIENPDVDELRLPAVSVAVAVNVKLPSANSGEV